MLASWLNDHTTERPHFSLDYAIPAAFAAGLTQQRPGSIRTVVLHPRSCATTSLGHRSPLDAS